MKRKVCGAFAPAVLAAGLAAAAGAAAGGDAFSVSASLSADGNRVTVSFHVPANHHLYADRIEVEPLGGLRLRPESIPAAKRVADRFSGEEAAVYDRDVALVYSVDGGAAPPAASVRVGYQGCSENMCFLPRSVTLPLAPAAAAAGAAAGQEPGPASPPGGGADWRGPIAGFAVTGTAAGYLSPAEFLRFLGEAESRGARPPDRLRRAIAEGGPWLGALLILLGGLALNLTPCVLPMIPVNLAILGAGSASGSRARGFVLGAAYGAGISLAYGALGVAVILTGTRFGTLNSSPWFNAGVAAVFALLSLAMFDVIRVDFSRFQSAGAPRAGGLAAALALGAMAALLAGACVAPVVISVLLLSADLYARGHGTGLALPFLLGAGMALPWPLAGAGLSFLPRPGRWMDRVKRAFGVVILLFAAWYGRLGFCLATDRCASSRRLVEQAQDGGASRGGWETSLAAGLARGLEQNRPVLVDIWASWCKNCLKMDSTTFRDPGVTGRLERYVKVKFRAENMGDPGVKAVLDHFEAIGLPTYAVLMPARGGGPAR